MHALPSFFCGGQLKDPAGDEVRKGVFVSNTEEIELEGCSLSLSLSLDLEFRVCPIQFPCFVFVSCLVIGLRLATHDFRCAIGRQQGESSFSPQIC